MESLSWTLSLSSTGLWRLTRCLCDRPAPFPVTSERLRECPGRVRGLSSPLVSVRETVLASVVRLSGSQLWELKKPPTLSARASGAAFSLSGSCFCFWFLIFVLRPPPPTVLFIPGWRFPVRGLLFLLLVLWWLRLELIAGPASPGQSVGQSSLLWDLRQSPAWQRGGVDRPGLGPLAPLPGTDLTERPADRRIVWKSPGDHSVLPRPR